MKKSLAILLVGALLLTLAGCGGTKKPAATANKSDLPLIGVSIFDYSNNFMGYVRRGIENYSKGKAQLIIADAQHDQAKQNDQIDTMISKGVKAIAINPVDPQAASAIIAKAKAANIPVIFFNKNPSKQDMFSYDKTWYVGIEPTNGGKIQAEMIAKAFKDHPEYDKNKDGVIQYVLIKGEPGHPDAEARTTRVISRMQELGLKTQQLELQSANWDTSKAKDIMETWLAKHGDKIELVICNNDAMALGAVEALKAHGYFTGTKYTPVIGINALPEVLDLVQKNIMLGSVLSSPWDQARAVVDLAVNAAQGKDPLAGTPWKLDDTKAVRQPDLPILKDNLDAARKAYENCK